MDETPDHVRQVHERALERPTSGEGQARPASNAEILFSGDTNRSGLQPTRLVPPSYVAIAAARPNSTRAWLFLAAVAMALWLLASFEFGR